MSSSICRQIALLWIGQGDRQQRDVGEPLVVLRFVGGLIAGLASMFTFATAAADDAATVVGRLSYEGKVYALQHVYAWQPPLQQEELWIYLTDRVLPPLVAQDEKLPEQLARDRILGGVKLIVHPVNPRLDDMSGVVYAPRTDGYSLDHFNFGPDWQVLSIANRHVTGKLRTAWMNWKLEAEFSVPVEGSTGTVRTLRGAPARHSQQAQVLIAFGKALVEGAVDAAGSYLSASKRAEMHARIARLGAAGFREFQAGWLVGMPLGEARRGQIERVDIDGDYAQVRARSEANTVHTALLVKIADEWRIDQW